MKDGKPLWLVHNASSGSNDAEALEEFSHTCSANGWSVAYRTTFPEENLPSQAMLDAAGIDLLAIFAGDGTINTTLDSLAGWSGSVLILPGGTMNLLYHRLFGELAMKDAIEAAACGKVERRRPGIIRCPAGNAYAGVLAGPGTAWSHVREALREADLLELAVEAREAISETLSGPMIACVEPPLGRSEGYPLLLLNAHDGAIDCAAYHAETAGEYLEQAWALMRRDFREGPHELLGRASRFVLHGAEGADLSILLDGEPAAATGAVEFALATCEVDLLATLPDGR